MSLILIPVLRLRGNRVMVRGADGQERADPARISEWAGEMASAGARWVHVEDLDAREGKPAQWTAIPALQSQGLRIQFGGGITRMLQVQKLLDLGVDRVVVGRQAQAEPRWAEELVRLYPGRVVLCLGSSADKDDKPLLDRARQANTWHVGGLLVPGDGPVAGRVDLVTRAHLAAPNPALFAYGPPEAAALADIHHAGAKGILLPDIESGDLQRLCAAFPQRAEIPPIQVLRARHDPMVEAADGEFGDTSEEDDGAD